MTKFAIVSVIKIIYCLAFLVFIFYRFFKEQNKIQSQDRSLRYYKSKLIILIIFVILSVNSYYNLGLLHGRYKGHPRFIHYHEFFIQYIGSKYFKELGYFNSYNAMVVADAEGENVLSKDAGIMNLKTYHFISKNEILQNAAYYKSLFSPLRWEEFKSDIKNLNQQALSPTAFRNAIADHGYHPPPVWNANASILANIVPVDKIIFLALLDVFLLVIMFIILAYSFGMETMLVASIFFYLNFFSSFYWMGGAFLRYDWLVASVTALSMINKNKYIPAGIFLSYATMVRIFPVLFLAGIAVKAALSIIKTRRLPKRYIQLLTSFILTSLILFAYGCTQGKGIENWKGFTKKIAFHNETLLTNNVGFKMLFLHDQSWSDYNKFIEIYGRTKENPYHILTDVKRIELRRRNIELLMFFLAVLLLFFLLVKNKDDVEAFSWGVFLIFMLLMPCNYYYAFLLMLAVIFYKRRVDLGNTLYLFLLFFIQIAGYIINLNDNFHLHIFYQLSCLLFIYFVYLLASEFYREFYYQKICSGGKRQGAGLVA